MSSFVLIYPNDTGGVCIAAPTSEWLLNPDNTIESLAKSIVPEGTAYKIVSSDTIPTDRTFRNAWEYQP